VIVGRWLQLAGVVKLLEDNGGGGRVVVVKSNSFPSGVSDGWSRGNIFRRVIVGRWLQLAGVVKLLECKGSFGCCRFVGLPREFTLCGFALCCVHKGR
jgi:hypothetical protein